MRATVPPKRSKTLLSALKKKKRIAGLTGIGPTPTGICIARVESDDTSRPRVTAFSFRAWDSATDEEALWAAVARDFGLAQSRCTTLLAPGEYSLLTTEAPDVPSEELKLAIRWRIKDLIDFHIDDATLDVFELPGEHAKGRARSMYAVAARSAAIRRRIDTLEKVGAGLEIIDIPELAQRNLAALVPEDENGLVTISFDRDQGLVTVTRRGELYLTRNLEIGTDALAQEGVTGYYDHVILEIQRSLDYYDSHFRQAPVRNLVVVPSAIDLSPFVEYVGNGLGMAAGLLDLGGLLEWETDAPDRLLTGCALTLGAALRREAVAL